VSTSFAIVGPAIILAIILIILAIILLGDLIGCGATPPNAEGVHEF